MAIPIAQELRERLTFQNVTAGPYSAVARTSQTVMNFRTCYARIIQQGGGELAIDTQQSQSSASNYEIWIRFVEGITGFMQIAWGARTLTISEPPQKFIDSNGRRWWIIQAREVVSE